MDFSFLYSQSTKKLKSSKIRELLKLANKPGIISLGGGMPDTKNLPFNQIKEIINDWKEDRAHIALQYGTTKGYAPLIEAIKFRMREKKNIPMVGQDVLVTTGSQQALALVSKLFLDPEDIVIVENPSFIGAIASFYSFMGELKGVDIDKGGMVIESLKEAIESLCKEGKKIKFIYTIPNFNNPSGITLTLERRKELLEVSHSYDIPIVEDDPYGDLFFDGTAEDYLPIKSLDKEGSVVYLGTFSKILSPGFRLGWIVADEALIAKLELQKQSFDACTPPFGQVVAEDYMRRGYMDVFIKKMRSVYKEKRDAALNACAMYMPSGVSWTEPRGGFFIWLTLPSTIDPEELFRKCVERNVAFVTGDAFLPYDYPNHYIRLSYSDLSPKRLNDGIRIIAEVIRDMM